MTTERTRDQIADQVRRMLAKANSANSTQAEIEAFAAKAEELVLRYNLSQAEINANSDKNPLDAYVSHTYELAKNKRDVTWQRRLIRTLASFYFCDIVHYSNSAYVSIVGEPGNVELLTFMYEILWREIKKLARADWRLNEADCRLRKVGKITRRNSFCSGAAAGIGARLRTERESFQDESAESNALIVVKDAEVAAAKAKFFPKLKPGRTIEVDNDAWNAGYDAAQTMHIRRGLKDAN